MHRAPRDSHIDLLKSPITVSLLNCVPGAHVGLARSRHRCCDASTRLAVGGAAAAADVSSIAPPVARWTTPTSSAEFGPQKNVVFFARVFEVNIWPFTSSYSKAVCIDSASHWNHLSKKLGRGLLKCSNVFPLILRKKR